MAYNVSSKYKEVVYSQDARYKLRLWFNEVELEDADVFCEKLTVKSRILPNSSKTFMLSNFVSKEATLVLHDINLENLIGKVRISIGTLVDNDYEYVPIGIFNIQDKPTNDGKKTTIKLRDNSVLLDYPYNAYSLIEDNGGTATKLQIFNDICSQFGIQSDIISFLHDSDPIGIYDSTINARTYISYIAEQAGAIPTINRDGKLIFVYLNNLVTHEIPLHLVESYENGDEYSIGYVVYESGIIKYPTGDETKDSLFLDGANPYISMQEHVEEIANIVNGFTINSFKTGKILGDASIDPYDLIKIVDGDKIFITLANNDFTYTGVCTQKFDTQIGLEERKTNVTTTSNSTYKKIANAEINNVDNYIKLTVEQRIQNLENNLENNYTKNDVLTNVITQTISETTNLISQTGGSNLLLNSQFYQEAENWNKSEDADFEILHGTVDIDQNTVSKSELKLIGGTLSQNYTTIIGKEYTVAFQYKKLGTPNTESSIKIFDGVNYKDILVETMQVNDRTQVALTYTATVNNPQLIISSGGDDFYITDLVIQSGTSTEWSQNANETRGLGHTLTGSNLTIYDVGASGEQVVIDPNSIAYYDGSNPAGFYSKLEMGVRQARIEEQLDACGLLTKKISDNETIIN